MISYVLLIIVIVLNLIPSGMNTFSVKTPEGELSRYSRQTDGSWKEMPQGATYRFRKDQLVIGGGERELSMGLAEIAQVFGYKADTDWASATGVPLARGKVLSLRRRADGLDIEFTSESNPARLYEVRWEAPAER
jgi:hypothetical protein